MARFFIDRPVFAWVISLLIVLAGVLAIRSLPVAQYPDIAPPVVNVSASYPGASAKVVEEAVTAIIEREMNGAPGLLYTKATSSTGQASLTLTFRQGVNADLAAVEVQNRLKIVESRLPESVRRDGIYVEKAADSIQLIVTLTSSSGRYDAMGWARSPRPTCCRRCAGWRAWARSRPGAPSTPCASGPTRPS